MPHYQYLKLWTQFSAFFAKIAFTQNFKNAEFCHFQGFDQIFFTKHDLKWHQGPQIYPETSKNQE
jgi:hypothetical protein